MIELKHGTFPEENLFSVHKTFTGYGTNPVVWIYQLVLTYQTKRGFHTIELNYGTEQERSSRDSDYEKIKNILLNK